MKRICLVHLVALALIVLAGCGFNPQTPTMDGDDGTTDEQLVRAIMAEDAAKVEDLLAAGANPNAHDNKGNALLPMAAMSGQTEIVRLLLDEGADVNITMKSSSSGKTALMQAAINNRSEIVELLITEGADVNQTESDSGYSALHFATQGSSETSVKTLLENGADPNLQAKDGRAPLHIAAKFRFFEIAEELLTAGAMINLPDNEGLTPMMVSIIDGRDAFISDTVRFLLHYGADPNWQDSNGSAALHHAALANRIDTIPVLMEYGASLDLKNNDGQTALDVAAYDIIRELLREAGASE
jgi:ankyrin repeat protein